MKRMGFMMCSMFLFVLGPTLYGLYSTRGKQRVHMISKYIIKANYNCMDSYTTLANLLSETQFVQSY